MNSRNDFYFSLILSTENKDKISEPIYRLDFLSTLKVKKIFHGKQLSILRSDYVEKMQICFKRLADLYLYTGIILSSCNLFSWKNFKSPFLWVYFHSPFP